MIDQADAVVRIETLVAELDRRPTQIMIEAKILEVTLDDEDAFGIDWSKQVKNTPSGRPYVYVDPLGATGDIPTDEIATIYG